MIASIFFIDLLHLPWTQNNAQPRAPVRCLEEPWASQSTPYANPLGASFAR
jgi:hypothetical protein